MSNQRVLVIFHSSSGNTRRVAQAIAEALNADLEQIQPTRPFEVDITQKGARNFRNMGRAAIRSLLKRAASIQPVAHAPAAYDLVIVGTPVYANSLPAPTRAFLKQYRADLLRVAFFCTGLDPENARVFELMANASEKAPVVTVAVHAPTVTEGTFHSQIEAFIAALR